MGKLEKTDRTGKTVEAWWALLFAEGSLGQSLLRWGWPMIGGAVGAWVASATDWISSYGVAGWAGTITIGMLAAIWGLAGFEHVRTKRWLRDHVIEPPQGSHSDLTALVDARLQEFLATKLAAEFVTHRQQHEYDEKLSELSERVKAARVLADGSQSYAEKRLGDLAMDIRSLEDQFADMKRKLDAWTLQHSDSVRRRFQNVDGGFRAIHDLETLRRLATEIEVEAHWLLRTRDGERVDDWTEWNSRHSAWLAHLGDYTEVAEHYLPELHRIITDVPAHKVQGQWPENRDAFPSDDAMIAHRTAAVILQNFTAKHRRVEACVTSFAFNSPSMKGIVS